MSEVDGSPTSSSISCDLGRTSPILGGDNLFTQENSRYPGARLHSQPCHVDELDNAWLVPGGGHFNVAGDLPNEIICEIFERYMEPNPRQSCHDSSEAKNPSYTRYPDPTILGHICSSWRDVAVNLPKLWSRIFIYNPKKCDVDRVIGFLQRSRTEPLELRINYNTAGRDFDYFSCAWILVAFVSRLEYWRRIQFYFPIAVAKILDYMTQVAGRHEPHLLRQASISFSECPEYFITSDQEPYIDAIWKVLHASPELRMVEWRGDGIDKIPKHAPFQQLTHCVCGFLTLSIEDVLSFLATIPLIQNLSIGDISVQSNLPFDLQVFARPLLLQHLRILTVRSESISIHSLFFKITCPSLKTLHIIHDDPTLFDLSELLPFLRRSKCQLKSFKIKNGNFSEDALETLLTSDTFRSVTSLKLIMTQVSDRIVLVFMKKTDDGHQFQVLRQLEDLTLLSCKTTDGLLAEMISSRRGGTGGSTATRLRKVHVGQEVGPIDTNFLKMHNLY